MPHDKMIGVVIPISFKNLNQAIFRGEHNNQINYSPCQSSQRQKSTFFLYWCVCACFKVAVVFFWLHSHREGINQAFWDDGVVACEIEQVGGNKEAAKISCETGNVVLGVTFCKNLWEHFCVWTVNGMTVLSHRNARLQASGRKGIRFQNGLLY